MHNASRCKGALTELSPEFSNKGREQKKKDILCCFKNFALAHSSWLSCQLYCMYIYDYDIQEIRAAKIRRILFFFYPLPTLLQCVLVPYTHTFTHPITANRQLSLSTETAVRIDVVIYTYMYYVTICMLHPCQKSLYHCDMVSLVVCRWKHEGDRSVSSVSNSSYLSLSFTHFCTPLSPVFIFPFPFLFFLSLPMYVCILPITFSIL